MYCKKCGAKIEAGNKFCSSCGAPVESSKGREYGIRDVTKQVSFKGRNEIRQPTKALVVEGIGFLFFLYLLLVNSISSRDSSAGNWLEDNGGGVFFIGLIFLAVSFFMFKKYKKENVLQGLGYAGYIMSCIAVILLVILILLSMLMIIPVILLD